MASNEDYLRYLISGKVPEVAAPSRATTKCSCVYDPLTRLDNIKSDVANNAEEFSALLRSIDSARHYRRAYP